MKFISVMIIILFSISSVNAIGFTYQNPLVEEIDFNKFKATFTANKNLNCPTVQNFINTSSELSDNIIMDSCTNQVISNVGYFSIIGHLKNYSIGNNKLFNPWFNTSWEYRQIYNITNGIVNYTILIDTPINNSDRWVNDSDNTLLSYWNETNNKVWIKLNCYGNCQISKYENASNSYPSLSNGTNTFILFDDFSGDLSKWDIYATQTYINNGYAQINISATAWTYFLRSKLSYNRSNIGYNLSYDYAVHLQTSSYSETKHGLDTSGAEYFYYGETISWNTAFYDNGTWKTPFITTVPTSDVFYRYSERLNASNGGFASSNVSTQTTYLSGIGNNMKVLFNPYKSGGRVDNVRLRYYTNISEPSYSIYETHTYNSYLNISNYNNYTNNSATNISLSSSGININFSVSNSVKIDNYTWIFNGVNVSNNNYFIKEFNISCCNGTNNLTLIVLNNTFSTNNSTMWNISLNVSIPEVITSYQIDYVILKNNNIYSFGNGTLNYRYIPIGIIDNEPIYNTNNTIFSINNMLYNLNISTGGLISKTILNEKILNYSIINNNFYVVTNNSVYFIYNNGSIGINNYVGD